MCFNQDMARLELHIGREQRLLDISFLNLFVSCRVVCQPVGDNSLGKHGAILKLELRFRRFFLLELRGSRTVVERLVTWAERMAMLYQQMGDVYRARQPVEWLLFVSDDVTDEERARLLRLRARLDDGFESTWSTDVADAGLRARDDDEEEG